MDQLFGSEVINIQEVMSVVSISIGLVFGYAAISKLADVRAFISGMRTFNIIPMRVVPFAASSLIAAEFVVAVGHLTDVALQIIAPTAVLLLSVFGAATLVTLKRGIKRPCLCFGANRESVVDTSTLARIILLFSGEVLLCSYMVLFDVSPVQDDLSVKGNIALVWISAISIALIGWFLAVPKLIRAWQVVRS